MKSVTRSTRKRYFYILQIIAVVSFYIFILFQQCSTHYVTEYETKYKDECHTTYVEDCHQVGYGYHKDYKCTKHPKKHCKKVPVSVSQIASFDVDV